jgi:hypothetical protein
MSLSIATGATALIAAAISIPAVVAGPGGGSGGHTEPVGNNLSFPVIWGDGLMALPGTMGQASLAVPWSDTELVEYQSAMHYAYAQKTAGNVWQAENEVWDPVANGALVVDEIDWGDSLESVDMKVGRPVRIELSLYKSRTLGAPMTGFVMAMLANPSSPDEVQGAIAPSPLGNRDNPVTNARTYPSPEATVYSANGKLVVQKLTGLREDVEADDLSWDGFKWIDSDPTDLISVGASQSLSFTGELNVGGKVIYGLSQGGWRPTSAGDYRVTFYLPLTPDPVTTQPKVSFDEFTTVRESVETEVAAAAEGDEAGGTAVVDPEHNLSYIDIRVSGGGGGGGGGGKPQ